MRREERILSHSCQKCLLKEGRTIRLFLFLMHHPLCFLSCPRVTSAVCRKRAGSAQMSVRLPAGCNAFLCPFSMSRNDPSNTEPGFRLLNYVCTTIALAKPKTEFTGWCVLISHLDCIHDTIGEDGHLSCNRLHSLFELCNVRARGKHVVQAWGSSWGRRIEGWVQKSCNCGSR